MAEKKTDLRVTHTKKLLKEGLLALMQEKPISEITVSELCRKSTVNRNTFYNHYYLPSDILTEIEKELFDYINQTIRENNDPIRTTLLICREMKRQQDLCTIIMSKNGDPQFLINAYGMIYQELLVKHYPKDIPKHRIDMINAYIIAGCVAIENEWVKGGMVESPEEIAMLVTELSENVLKPYR